MLQLLVLPPLQWRGVWHLRGPNTSALNSNKHFVYTMTIQHYTYIISVYPCNALLLPFSKKKEKSMLLCFEHMQFVHVSPLFARKRQKWKSTWYIYMSVADPGYSFAIYHLVEC